jgi:hypothetical protein
MLFWVLPKVSYRCHPLALIEMKRHIYQHALLHNSSDRFQSAGNTMTHHFRLRFKLAPKLTRPKRLLQVEIGGLF